MGIIESVQQYDLNIPAGGAQNIDVAGDRVQFLSATDPFAQVEIRPNYAQGNISLKPGQGFRFSQQVTRWVVFNRGAVALSGYLLIGSGDFFDQRIAGTVDVIDGGKARTLGQQSYVGTSYASSGAGQVALMQLWNPAGSGKKALIEQLSVTCTVSCLVDMLLNAAPIANLNGGSGFSSKLSGGAASAMQGRWETPAAFAGTVAMTFGAASWATVIFAYKEPLILMPGAGMVLNAKAQTQAAVNWEWYEEPI